MVVDRVWPLVTAAEMRDLDRHTIEQLGVAGEVLMESAGRAVAECVLANLDSSSGEPPQVGIVCGAGNNGGDGFVIARQLHLVGVDVEVVIVGSADGLPQDAAINYRRMLALGIEATEDLSVLDDASVVVDALFGTGLARPLEGDAADAVAAINRAGLSGAFVIAVDLPSGLDADTGQVLGVAVSADETVTIGLPKLGLCQEPGREHAGDIYVARIGIADEAPETSAGAELWTPEACADVLPERHAEGHKGSFGHVLVIAGSPGKTGAAHLASLGAARMGAGLVTVACPAGVGAILEIKTTEAMTVAVPDTEGHCFASASVSKLLSLAGERDVVVMGPGVGQLDETSGLMRELGKRVEQPLVIDADGLNAFAGEDGLIKILHGRSAQTVLTPHPGEAARLLGVTSAEINRDRVAAARQLADAANAVVLLKGACSVIASPEGHVAINPTGGPNLSAGGTGDVLAGMVAALLGQGLGPFDAAALAAWIHGGAADQLAEQMGESGLLASELADELPDCCEALRLGRVSASDENDPEVGLHEREFSFLLPFPFA